MADAYYVTVDMEKLRSRLKWSDGAPATMEHARAWLASNDFRSTGRAEVWIAEEISLAALEPGEVVELKPYA